MFSLSFLWLFPSVVPCSHALVYWESFKDTKSVWYTHMFSWWSWWESHPCLKSYWTTSLSHYGEMRFRYIYTLCKKRTMRLSLYFDTKNFGPANFSRIVIAALVCAFYRNSLHITFLPQSHWRGSYPRSPFNETFFYLWTTLPKAWECLGSNSYIIVASNTM